MKKSASGREGLTVKTRDFLIKSEAIQAEYVPEQILVQHPSKTSETVLDVVTPAVFLKKRASKFAETDPILSELHIDPKKQQEQNSTEDEYRNRKTYKKREIKDQAKQSDFSLDLAQEEVRTRKSKSQKDALWKLFK